MSLSGDPAKVNCMRCLEVCVDTLADAIAAIDGGADRLELCGALELGGLTPSIGLVKEVLAHTEVPVVVMMRPRAGGFCYNRNELATAYRDAEEALAAGARGIVFGFLKSDGCIDEQASQRIVELAGTADVVFHRAFDFVPDPSIALDQLIDLRVTRLLTSGQQPTALAGAPLISRLVLQAAGRIQILPGGGVRPENVTELLSATGCEQVHLGASMVRPDHSLETNHAIGLRDPRQLREGEYRAVDVDLVRQTAQRLVLWPS